MDISNSMLTPGIIACTACALGAAVAWILCSKRASSELDDLDNDWQSRLDKETRDRKRVAGEADTLRAALDAERVLLQKFKHAAVARSTELQSFKEKINALSKDLFTLGSERDQLGQKLVNIQKSLIVTKHRATELQTEFGKSREFYKGQLASAFELRKSLERKVDEAKLEHDSLATQLNSARSEHASVNNMLATAQARLGGLDALEQQVIALEADNAQLKHNVAIASQRVESARRDATESDALKHQNRELAQCLESMEQSRRQYEEDAQRYRTQYDDSANESETLRIKLGDIQQRLAEMQEEHVDARKTVDSAKANLPPFGVEKPDGEADDLTEIVGIGKVFEAMLHRLGIYYFRQIAAFGPAELARVNAELNEFKGRIEHDDWIGQAKELHFRKYGSGDRQISAV
jgi:predicted flap endonuclease-1-like 5' DNA nuclease